MKRKNNLKLYYENSKIKIPKNIKKKNECFYVKS